LQLPDHSQSGDGKAPASNAATDYSADTGRRLKFVAGVAAAVLIVAFLIMHLAKLHAERTLARDTIAASANAPLVEVVTVRTAAAGRPLTLPGETAAWYESLIYTRVSGYVGTWSADIGDHVAMGQVLATIETPELDADYLAAKAKLTAAQAQVKVKQAEAEFAASTYARAIRPKESSPSRSVKTRRPVRHRAPPNSTPHARRSTLRRPMSSGWLHLSNSSG
jgi:biotin carboxyl carrier protein